MSDLEIIDHLWFDKVGIIKTRNSVTQEVAVFIGVGDGMSEREDIDNILRWGTKLTHSSLPIMFRFFDTAQRIAELEEENTKLQKELKKYSSYKTDDERIKGLQDVCGQWAEENTKLKEQLKNTPKFNCGDIFYYRGDDDIYESFVTQVILYRDRLSYVNENGVHFECDYGKEGEQGIFATEAEAQKYLEGIK